MTHKMSRASKSVLLRLLLNLLIFLISKQSTGQIIRISLPKLLILVEKIRKNSINKQP